MSVDDNKWRTWLEDAISLSKGLRHHLFISLRSPFSVIVVAGGIRYSFIFLGS